MLKWLKAVRGIGGSGKAKLDHPLQEVNEAERVASALSLREPVKALEEAAQWLDSIAQTRALGAEQRFELICMLDAATRKAQARVVDDYVTLMEHDGDQEQRLWQTASDFSTRLGEGYLACTRQFGSTADALIEVKPLVPLLTARGMRALRLQLKWVSMRYGTPRADIWGEFARFLSLAESVDAAATRVELYAGTNLPTSANNEFLRAVTFWSAMPGALSPVEQDIAERLISHFTPKFQFTAEYTEGCDYFFDLNSSRPPLRFVRSVPVTAVTAATRYFDVSEARHALQAMHTVIIRSGMLPTGVDCGPAAEINVTVRVLKHLAVNWGKDLPPRASGRRKTEMNLSVLVGYERVLAAVTDCSPQAGNGATQTMPEFWISHDLSANGCGAIASSGSGALLRVGMLVALLPATDMPLILGIIRRVHDLGEKRHHIGIQFISKSALPVYLRSLPGARRGSNYESAIQLTAAPSPNGYLHIVARRDIFSGREPVEALYGNPADGENNSERAGENARGKREGHPQPESAVIL